MSANENQRPVSAFATCMRVAITSIVFICVLFYGSLSMFKLFEEIDLFVWAGFLSWGGFVCVLCFKYHRFGKVCRDPVSVCIVLFMLNIIMVSYITGVLVYGQPLLGIVRSLVRWGGLTIYPTLLMLGNVPGLEKRIIKFLLIVGVSSMALSMFTQIFDLYDVLFIRAPYERMGTIRAPRLFIRIAVFSLFFFFVHCFYSRSLKKLLFLLLAGMMFYVIAFAILSRRHFVLIPIMLIYFIIRNLPFHISLKILFVCMAILLLLFLSIPPFYAYMVEYGSDLWDSFFDPQSSSYGSAQIRVESLQYYWNYFKQSNFIGFGKISTTRGDTTNPIAVALSEEHSGMYLTDLGIIGVLFQWGFSGIVIVGASLYVCFRRIYFIKTYGLLEQRSLATTIELCFIFELCRWGPFWADLYFNYVVFLLYLYLLTAIHNRLLRTRSVMLQTAGRLM